MLLSNNVAVNALCNMFLSGLESEVSILEKAAKGIKPRIDQLVQSLGIQRQIPVGPQCDLNDLLRDFLDDALADFTNNETLRDIQNIIENCPYFKRNPFLSAVSAAIDKIRDAILDFFKDRPDFITDGFDGNNLDFILITFEASLINDLLDQLDIKGKLAAIDDLIQCIDVFCSGRASDLADQVTDIEQSLRLDDTGHIDMNLIFAEAGSSNDEKNCFDALSKARISRVLVLG